MMQKKSLWEKVYICPFKCDWRNAEEILSFGLGHYWRPPAVQQERRSRSFVKDAKGWTSGLPRTARKLLASTLRAGETVR